MARTERVKTNCGTCDAEIEVPPYRIRRSQSGLVFCSPACLDRNPVVIESKMRTQRTAVERTCPVCGTVFKRKLAELREVNYCSNSCSAKANMRLKPIPRGKRTAPTTEFPKGNRPKNWAPVGTVRFRKHRGVVRAWVKVTEPRTWQMRAVIAWESANGPLPDGYLVHHKDRNPLNDEPSNLQALTRAEHLAEHRSDFR